MENGRFRWIFRGWSGGSPSAGRRHPRGPPGLAVV